MSVDILKLMEESQRKETKEQIAELLGGTKTEKGESDEHGKSGDPGENKEGKAGEGKGSGGSGGESENAGEGKGGDGKPGGKSKGEARVGGEEGKEGKKDEGKRADEKGEAAAKGAKDEGKPTGESKEDTEKKDASTKEDSVISVLKSQNAILLGQVETLSQLGLRGYTQEESTNTDKKGAETKKTSDKDSADNKPKSVAFVADDDLENVLSSADSLNKLLNKVANVAALEGEQRGYKRAIMDTPNIVSKIAGEQMTARDAARDFLDVNPDLLPVRSFLGLIANELQAQHPEWDVKTLFEKSGEETRKRLQLSKDVEDVDKEQRSEDKSSLPKRGAGGGGGTRTDKGSGLTELQTDIGALVKHAEG